MSRDAALDAVRDTLRAMYPARDIERGLRDPAVLGDEVLRRGAYSVIAEDMGDWTGYVGAEAESATLRFAIVAHCLAGPDQTTLDLERLEGAMQEELLAWCRARKASPIDAVYPETCAYSGGLEMPVGWIVMRLEARYV